MELTLPTDAEITREGYRFDGWYDEANNKPYQTGDRMPNADLTLYAKWTPKSYKVIYQNEDETTYEEESHDVNSEVSVRKTILKRTASPLLVGRLRRRV